MKICRYDGHKLGIINDGRLYDATHVMEAAPPLAWPLPYEDPMIARLSAIRNAPLTGKGLAIEEVVLDSPVANPTKLVAAPVNYRAHHDEAQADATISAGRPVLKIEDAGLFLKANSALIGPGQDIEVAFPTRRTDHELELAVVIGRRCKNVALNEALDVVAGYCIGLDITVRGSEDRSFRKSIDSYAVLGPWLTTADEISDPDDLDMELRVNGEVRQRSNTRYLIKGVRELIRWASEWYTLHPGDVIFTGTPEGVAPIEPGDVLEAAIQSLGSMTVGVRAAIGARTSQTAV